MLPPKESAMKIIKIEACDWKSIDDFYVSIKRSLMSPSWHGDNINALIDSIVYGDINGVTPPFKVIIVGLAGADSEVRSHVMMAAQYLTEAIQQEGKSCIIAIEAKD